MMDLTIHSRAGNVRPSSKHLVDYHGEGTKMSYTAIKKWQKSISFVCELV